MAERTSHETGTFSWADLATTDQDGAKAFYSALFGWDYVDNPIADGTVYSMCRLEGKDVAAIAPQNQQERDQGIPPHWNSYITTHDLDERAPRATELSGALIMPPFDVMDAGRMALAADPTGAVFAMWLPKNSIGAELVNVPGALAWNELGTSDPEAAKRFYADLFGWSYDEIEMNGAGTYAMIKNGDRSNGGIRPLTPQEQGMPPFWLVYFGTASCDETVATAERHGGRALVPKVTIPAGSFSVIADPADAVFAIFEGDFDE